MAEALPGRRTVDLGGLVELGRDRLQSAEQRDHHEGDADPGVDHDGGGPLPEGVTQPGRGGQMERIQRQVEDAAVVGEDQPPGEDGDKGRHGPRQDQDHPVEGAAAELAVEQQREPHADAVVQGHTDHGPDDGPGEVGPELVVAPGEDLRVVVETHPGEAVGDLVDADRLADVVAVGVGQRQIDAADQRVDHQHTDDRDHRGHHGPGVPIAVVRLPDTADRPAARRGATAGLLTSALDGDGHLRHLCDRFLSGCTACAVVVRPGFPGRTTTGDGVRRSP